MNKQFYQSKIEEWTEKSIAFARIGDEDNFNACEREINNYEQMLKMCGE